MKIFLLGAGYVGMTLLSSWKNLNDIFTATTTTESKLKEIISQSNTANSLLLKINKNSNLSETFNNHEVLIISIAPLKGSNYKETYLETSEVIRKFLEHRKVPLYLLYISSTSIYGNQEGRIVSENDVRNPYSENSHLLCKVEDNYLSISNKHIVTCVLRLGGIYGPNRTLENRALKMSGIELPGTGEEPTNHSHLEDINNAIEYCINYKLSGVYNIVGDDHSTRKELYNKLCKSLKVDPPIWQASRKKMRVTNALVSNDKIKEAGFEFKHPFINF